MSLRSLMIHEVEITTLVAGDERDGYGNPIPTAGEPVTAPARVEALLSTEDEADRQTRTSEYRVFLLPGAPVAATSRITWQEREHEVVGRPQAIDGRRGPHHIELVMRIVEG